MRLEDVQADKVEDEVFDRIENVHRRRKELQDVKKINKTIHLKYDF